MWIDRDWWGEMRRSTHPARWAPLSCRFFIRGFPPNKNAAPRRGFSLPGADVNQSQTQGTPMYTLASMTRVKSPLLGGVPVGRGGSDLRSSPHTIDRQPSLAKPLLLENRFMQIRYQLIPIVTFGCTAWDCGYFCPIAAFNRFMDDYR